MQQRTTRPRPLRRWGAMLGYGLVILGLVAGCDSGTGAPTAIPTPGPTAPPSASRAAGCQYIFDATVRQGPSAGLNLHGHLVLLQKDAADPAGFYGFMVPAGAEEERARYVPVAAQATSQTVTLRFTLADSSTITGTGSMDAPIGNCTGTMNGSFSGPKAGDSGDWLGGTTSRTLCNAPLRAAFNVDMCISNLFACCK